MNKLYNDTAVQAIANAIRAKNGSSDTYTIAEMSTALNDISYYAKPIISNVPIATFEADGLPLNSLKVSVDAKQAGSGTPSPENVRPISGWDAVVVTDTDDVDNPTVTQTTTISLGQTVYGGELDVVNGTSGNKLTHDVVDLGDLTWSLLSTNTPNIYRYQAVINDMTVTTNITSSEFEQVSAQDTYRCINGICAGDGIIILYDETRDTLNTTEFRNAISGVQLCYPLATPTTFTTQPVPIKSLNGINNLSVDCGDVIELEYFKEV